MHISIPLFGMELPDCDKLFTIPTNIITLMKSHGANYLRNLMPCSLPVNLYFHYCPLLHGIEKFQTNWGINSINVRYKHVTDANLISYQKCVHYARTKLCNTLSSNKTKSGYKTFEGRMERLSLSALFMYCRRFYFNWKIISSVQIVNKFLTQIPRCVLATSLCLISIT